MDGRPDNPPIVITDTVKNAIRIVALEAHAKASGLYINQTLSDARALIPDVENHAYNHGKTHALLLRIALWCERYTPLVALSGTLKITNAGLFMDVTGCTHLMDSEEALVEDLEHRLKAQGFCARICLADTSGAAWAMAHYGDENIISSGKHKIQISLLPLSALRLPSTIVEALTRVGLKTIGCIADLPRAPLAARFGADLLRRLDQALGREEEVISPIMPVAELVSERRFADPIVYEDDIKDIIAQIAKNLIPTLEKRGLGARECGVKLFRVDGKVSHLTVQSATPLRDAKQIARLFHERLAGLHDDLDFGFGFDVIRLEILRADDFDIQQTDLVEGTLAQDQYDALVNRLGARLGTDRVQKFVFTDTHIPEREFTCVSVINASPNHALKIEEPSKLLTRPIILFDRPERIETTAQIPDGAPIRFRWRKVFYDVEKSEGPERIACEWWRDGRAAKTRDYFRVEAEGGYHFWVFRHGLYKRETNMPNWYMHGLFA